MTTDTQISKTLSYWLRHRPDEAGLTLSAEGWADVDQLLAALARNKVEVDWDRLLHVIETNDKSRFELSPDCTHMRARQGHTVDVIAAWSSALPPEYLYHGTVERFLSSIEATGLQRMKRHHVHLSPDAEAARRVGARRGAPIVLRVHSGRLATDGTPFFMATNGVWLVDHVPPSYLERL